MSKLRQVVKSNPIGGIVICKLVIVPESAFAYCHRSPSAILITAETKNHLHSPPNIFLY